MKDPRPSDTAILVRLPKELRDELAAAAAESERSTAALIRLLAREYLAAPKGGRK